MVSHLRNLRCKSVGVECRAELTDSMGRLPDSRRRAGNPARIRWSRISDSTEARSVSRLRRIMSGTPFA